jgi:hypothetical protein
MIEDWWRVDFTTPARITVDYGRDTKAMLDVVRTGAMSGRRFAEMHGMDEEQEEDAAIASYLRRKQKCEALGLDFNDVFPPAPGSPMTAPEDQLSEEAKEEAEEKQVEQIEEDGLTKWLT